MAAEPRPLKTPAARIQRGFAMLKPCNLSHARERCEQRGIGSTAKLKSVKDGHHDIRRASFALGVQVVHSASMADRVLVRTAPFAPRSGPLSSFRRVARSNGVPRCQHIEPIAALSTKALDMSNSRYLVRLMSRA